MILLRKEWKRSMILNNYCSNIMILILKFYLHVSPAEQLQRLTERIREVLKKSGSIMKMILPKQASGIFICKCMRIVLKVAMITMDDCSVRPELV